MKTRQKPKSNQYYVPISMQRLFVFIIIPAFTLLTASMVWSIIGQANQGSDVKAALSFALTQQILPALLFVLAYVLNPRKLPWLSRAFESLLVALAALIGWGLITNLIFTLVFASIDMLNIMQMDVYVSASHIVFVSAFVALLLYLRAKGKWA